MLFSQLAVYSYKRKTKFVKTSEFSPTTFAKNPLLVVDRSEWNLNLTLPSRVTLKGRAKFEPENLGFSWTSFIT